MFDSVVAAVSPRRARLAGPVAALAHGLVFASLIGVALWNAAELQLPDPPERAPIFSVGLSSVVGGSTGGGRRDTRTPRGQQKQALRANAFPTRLPEEASAVTETDLPVGDGPQQGDGDPNQIGLGDDQEGPGNCPSCPVGSETGDRSDVVDGSVIAPILVRRVEPTYPETLRKLRQEGRVVLEAIIARNGSIDEIRVVFSANALFEEAAVRAVGQWRYEPCLIAGRAVRVRLLVTVNFRLNS